MKTITITSVFHGNDEHSPIWTFHTDGIEDPIFEIYDIGKGYLLLGLYSTGGYQRKVVKTIAQARRLMKSDRWLHEVRWMKGSTLAEVSFE